MNLLLGTTSTMGYSRGDRLGRFQFSHGNLVAQLGNQEREGPGFGVAESLEVVLYVGGGLSCLLQRARAKFWCARSTVIPGVIDQTKAGLNSRFDELNVDLLRYRQTSWMGHTQSPVCLRKCNAGRGARSVEIPRLPRIVRFS